MREGAEHGARRALVRWLWHQGRVWLPTGAKRWIKRAILRQTASSWKPAAPPSELYLPFGTGTTQDGPACPGTQCYDILLLPIIDWEDRFQRPQQLAKGLAKRGHRVFWCRIPSATFNPGHRRPSARVLDANIREVVLPAPSRGFGLYARRIDQRGIRSICDAISRLKEQCGLRHVEILVSFPNWRAVAEELRARFGWTIIYDCMEDHAAFSQLPPWIADEEAQLAASADLVLAASHPLAEKMRRHSRNVLVLLNAADLGKFSAQLPGGPLDRLPRPIIGYVGIINEWFDEELVRVAALQRPEWSFVLVGAVVGMHLTSLRSLPNVHLVGEKNHDALPSFLHAFDVATIMHKRTDRTHRSGSVKFFEYLAAGKPVVMPDLEWARQYPEYAYTVNDVAGFVAACERAMAEDGPKRVALRRRFAKQHTWGARAAELESALNLLYPRVTIILVTFNGLEYTRLCIDSVLRNTDWPNFELVLVDNASSDGTQDYLRHVCGKHRNARMIANPTNLGFAGGNNVGIRAATGEFILLLNSDTIVTAGWLTRLVRLLEAEPDLGVVSAVTNNAGNECRIDVDYNDAAGIESFAQRRADAFRGKTLQLRMAPLFCALVRRSLFDEVGLLDERYGRGMFEDDDFALRARQVGKRIVCAEDVFIHHFGGMSMSRLQEAEYQVLFDTNRRRFEEKWGTKWRPHKYR